MRKPILKSIWHDLILLLAAMALAAGPAAAQSAVHGTGTTGTLPLWTNSTTIGNSSVTQSGSNVSVKGNLSLTGSINSALTLMGNVTDSNGNQGANVIGGFGGNSVAAGVVGATIAGGGGVVGDGTNSQPNSVTAFLGTVGGGWGNMASGADATVAGGASNTASGAEATVAGGSGNTASDEGAAVAGGYHNTASGFTSFAAGYNNASGGNGSFAAGIFAAAANDGSFVWGDASTILIPSATPVSSAGPNQFVARSTGGVTFWTGIDGSGNPNVGATLASGSGSWSSVSDRNLKANFAAIDGASLLAKIATLPISTWNYTTQEPSIRHMGPVAQDFRAAFGPGEDDKHISTVDADGVALAGIQVLYQQLEQLKQDRDNLAATVAQLQARLAKLEKKRQ